MASKILKISKAGETRAKNISEYIKKHKNDVNVVLPHNKKRTEQRGKVKYVQVYRLPRRLCVLNAYNHRFGTEWENIREERVAAGKHKELDVTNVDDIETIRDVLKGKDPPNKTRTQTFEELKEGIEKASEESEDRDFNGQTTPGIITWDGIYVNGNRRDTALQVIKDERLKNKKNRKRGTETKKFDFIIVCRCDEGLWEDDVMAMEMYEQISKDLRDPYDYMNAAILIKKKYNSQLLAKLSKSDTKAQKNKKIDEVVQSIANKMVGVGTKKVEEYLNFMKFVDGILILNKKPGQYNVVNKSSGALTPISYLLREAAKEWTKIGSTSGKTEFMKFIAIECAVHQNLHTKDLFKVRDNYRAYRKATTTKQSKAILKKVVDRFDWKKLDSSCKSAVSSLNQAVSIQKAEEDANKPDELLNKVLTEILQVQKSLTMGARSKKLEKLAQNPDILDDIIVGAEDIQKSLRKYKMVQKSIAIKHTRSRTKKGQKRKAKKQKRRQVKRVKKKIKKKRR